MWDAGVSSQRARATFGDELVSDIPRACFEMYCCPNVILGLQMLMCRVLLANHTILLSVAHPHPPWKMRQREVRMEPPIRGIFGFWDDPPWGRRYPLILRALVADAPPTSMLNLPLPAHLDLKHRLHVQGPRWRLSSR